MKRFRKMLLAEVGIEFKACMYFFCILFFYCVYRIIHGSFQADMLVMLEMILTTYVMSYIQVFLLRNFEEAERFGVFECFACLGCALAYMGLSFLFGWFDRSWLPGVLFFLYMIASYASMCCIYYVRRNWDTKELNQELESFKNHQGSFGNQ